ncbi:MAG TPA: hypothetical protein K8V27_11250 [Butyricicoccus pullicaecorum]|nr:hypothetical protein [Butyricicoccus pullicaecorum]
MQIEFIQHTPPPTKCGLWFKSAKRRLEPLKFFQKSRRYIAPILMLECRMLPRCGSTICLYHTLFIRRRQWQKQIFFSILTVNTKMLLDFLCETSIIKAAGARISRSSRLIYSAKE